jgi:hypothetical protein
MPLSELLWLLSLLLFALLLCVINGLLELAEEREGQEGRQGRECRGGGNVIDGVFSGIEQPADTYGCGPEVRRGDEAEA